MIGDYNSNVCCCCTPKALTHAHSHTNVPHRLGKRLVVFGGKADDGSLLGDTWLFSLDTMQWTQLDASATAPQKRFSMVAAIDQGGGRNRFLIAVGEGNDGSRAFYNDVWALDLVTNRTTIEHTKHYHPPQAHLALFITNRPPTHQPGRSSLQQARLLQCDTALPVAPGPLIQHSCSSHTALLVNATKIRLQ